MHYYYNESEKSFAVTINFEYNPIPKGFKKISKAKYEELQEELNKDINENVESDEVTSV